MGMVDFSCSRQTAVKKIRILNIQHEKKGRLVIYKNRFAKSRFFNIDVENANLRHIYEYYPRSGFYFSPSRNTRCVRSI